MVEAVADRRLQNDVDITSGAYGWAPPEREQLILRHQPLGRVVLDRGPTLACKRVRPDRQIVQHRDLVPMPNSAVGKSDMCRNRRITERGIKEIQRVHVRALAEGRPRFFAGGLPSLGPPSGADGARHLVTKASKLVGVMRARAFLGGPRRGSSSPQAPSPISLLGGSDGTSRGLDVHVLNQVTEGAKPQLMRDFAPPTTPVQSSNIGFAPDVHRRVHRGWFR